jgi:hypothetical protein
VPKHDFSLEFVEANIDTGDGVRTLKFYPLNFKALRVLAGELKAIKDANEPDGQFASICKVLAASANRKGKMVSAEELEELLSVQWANTIIGDVNMLSGMVKTKEGTVIDPKAPMMNRTGGESTVGSSPTQDGAGVRLTN